MRWCPNRPLQQTKPHTILKAIVDHACGFAAERQGRYAAPEHHESSHEVRNGVASEIPAAGLLQRAWAQRARIECAGPLATKP
jgi:hypothetical protein